jgi:hypothetical protein
MNAGRDHRAEKSGRNNGESAVFIEGQRCTGLANCLSDIDICYFSGSFQAQGIGYNRSYILWTEKTLRVVGFSFCGVDSRLRGSSSAS